MFFTALNPFAKESGTESIIDYNKIIIDETVIEQLEQFFTKDTPLLDRINRTFDIVLGDHFVLNDPNHSSGKKGLLDFLILPLLARKLISDCSLKDRENAYIRNSLAFIIALPIELARFAAGIALTMLLIVPVMLLHPIISYCNSKDETDNNYQKTF